MKEENKKPIDVVLEMLKANKEAANKLCDEAEKIANKKLSSS